MMNYTDFQPYILPETDVWALPTQKAMELLEYLENKGMKQVICVPPVRQENPNNTTENLTMDQVKAIYTETCCQIPSG